MLASGNIAVIQTISGSGWWGLCSLLSRHADLGSGVQPAGEAGAGGQPAPGQPRYVHVSGHLHGGRPQRALQPPEEARVRQVSAGGQHVLSRPKQKIIVKPQSPYFLSYPPFPFILFPNLLNIQSHG